MNYARNIKTKELFFFEGREFHPTEPQDWATFRPLPNPLLHRIGEDEDVYTLRQLLLTSEGTRAKRINELLYIHQSRPFSAEERLEVDIYVNG